MAQTSVTHTNPAVQSGFSHFLSGFSLANLDRFLSIAGTIAQVASASGEHVSPNVLKRIGEASIIVHATGAAIGAAVPAVAPTTELTTVPTIEQ